MVSSYFKNLKKAVIDNSKGKTWNEAVNEWEITGWNEDSECNSQCTCGKEGLRYLYTIFNPITENTLFPIGSCCIKRFGRQELNEKIETLEGMFKLYYAIRNNERIELSSKYFSKKLLLALYKDNAFPPNKYNHNDGKNDYQFMLEMFNKRDKLAITDNQRKKINAIIAWSIRPYLKQKLNFNTTGVIK